MNKQDSSFNILITPYLILVLFCLTAFFAKVGGTGLASYDDLYYAEKAREMLLLKSFWTPHYNYVPSLDIAPFFLWLLILSYKVFGVNEYAAVFPSAILALSTVSLVYWWMRRQTNTQIAFMAALILATIPQYMKFARHPMLDVTLTFFTVTSLISFYEASKGRSRLYLLWGLAAAGGILTKSVLGTFPIWIGIGYIIVGRRWRELLNPFFYLGIIVGAAVGTSWYVSQYFINHDLFVYDHLLNIIKSRAAISDGDYSLAYRFKYFLLPIQYIPHWCIFMIAGLVISVRQALNKSSLHLFVVLWLAAIVGVLSVAANTKTWYMMSAFPALAIMGAFGVDWFVRRFSANALLFYNRFIKIVGVIALVYAVVILATPLKLGIQRESDAREFSGYIRTMGQAGFKFIGYKIDLIAVNNSVLFYAEHGVTGEFFKPEEFLAKSGGQEPLMAILPKIYWPELQNTNWFVVKEGEKFMLIANRAADFSKVKQLDLRWMQ